MTIEERMIALTELCRNMAWSWTLQCSEAENCFYAHAEGIGKGEYLEIKRASTAFDAIDRLIKRVMEIK